MSTKRLIFPIVFAALLCGCADKDQAEKKDENVAAIEFVDQTESAPEETPKTESKPEEPSKPKEAAGRQDGEKFEETIMLEGSEETVRYEHVKDSAIGFEMDYEYETLTRKKESDKEIFASTYDDPENPWNYLEVMYIDKTVDNAAASVSDELSKEYDLSTEQGALDKAGSCTKIITVSAKSGAKSPDFLQTVYVLPAGDGSIVAAAHYTIESAEGFGGRFDRMVNSLEVIGRTAESNLSKEQALEAVRKYCMANNPDLASISASDDHTVYWDSSINEAGEIVVLYRSYTGAQLRYYIDPDSGQTYVTELVPGIIDEEQRTDETFNVRDYME